MDIANFNTRVAQQNTMIMALDIIITNLTYIVETSSFVQKEQVLEQLRKIPKNNALASLVTLSTSFSPATVNAIIQKLKEIRDSLSASIEKDEAYELVAQENYLNLLGEFEIARVNVNKSLEDTNARILVVDVEIQDYNKQIADDNAQIVVDQQELDEYVRQQAEFNVLYQQRFEARFIRIFLLGKCLFLLGNNENHV